MGLRIAESVRRTRREHLEHVSSVLAEISIVAAATFSLSRGRWLVPGIGTIKKVPEIKPRQMPAMRRSAVLGCGKLLQRFHQLEVVAQIVALKPALLRRRLRLTCRHEQELH